MACRKKRRFNANGEPEAAAVGVYGTPEQKTIEQKNQKKIEETGWQKWYVLKRISWAMTGVRPRKNKYPATQSTVPEYLLAGPLVVNIKGTTPILPRDELRLLAPLPLVQEPFRAPGVRAGARSGCEGIWQVTCRTSPRRPRELGGIPVRGNQGNRTKTWTGRAAPGTLFSPPPDGPGFHGRERGIFDMLL